MPFDPQPLVPKPNHPKGIGDHGEQLVIDTISVLPAVVDGGCVLLNDILLPAEDGARVQVDHILVCPTVLLVVETKSWSGDIYGTAELGDWTQKTEAGKERQFRNPVLQNQQQSETLADHIGYGPQIIPVVVMVGDGVLKMDAGPSVATLVELRSYIADVSIQPGPIDVEAVASRIRAVAVNHTPETAGTSEPGAITDADILFQCLRDWRTDTAKREDKPPLHVLYDKTLRAIAIQKPATEEQLLNIDGIGPTKFERYGEDLLALIEVERLASNAADSTAAGSTYIPKHAQ